MADNFASHEAALSSPAEHAAAITPNDTTDLSVATRALYVGNAGDVAVILVGDSAAVTFANMQAGVVYPLRIARVLDTGTDATDLVGLY